MKSVYFPLLLQSVQSATLKSNESPISRVVQLIIELKAGVETDGKKEQQSYDKYACWCEKTLARKAKAIGDEKDLIEKMQKLILKLKGDLGAHGAEIAQLKKDIGENKEAQKEATEVRKKENDEYEASKMENEQCIGALEAAIKVLTGAGQGKGFLQTMQQAQLLSVVGGVRQVLARPLLADQLSANDAETIRKFVQDPQVFMSQTASALQVGGSQNPFGDYAPQSTQIQGILKGMYDAFTADLEKDNAEEADKQKSFEEFMATKIEELETLEDTLETQEADNAAKTEELAESKTTRDDTKAQLEADEQFFEDTKAGCKVKAKEWAERSRLRTEELTGINKAIEILSSPEAHATFGSSATTFLQVFTKKSEQRGHSQAFAKLRTLATKYRSQEMSSLAAKVKNGGHFDKLFVIIDEMIANLRKEEQEDIAHRDRCEASGNKNENDKGDLVHSIEKADASIQRLNNKATELKQTISSLEGEIASTKQSMKEALDMRNTEARQFKKALQDDAAAIAVIEKAIVAMSAFYKNNKIPLEFLVQKSKEPEYSVDSDKAPETTWSGGSYGGRQSESGGIVSILEMVKEDTANEMKEARQDEADAQAAFERDRASQQETLNAQKRSKVQAEKELAETEQKIADTQEAKSGRAADLAEEQKLAGTLENDCKWVKTHFDSRRENRKDEIDGLMEAKNYLAGAGIESDDDLD